MPHHPLQLWGISPASHYLYQPAVPDARTRSRPAAAAEQERGCRFERQQASGVWPINWRSRCHPRPERHAVANSAK